MSAAPTSLASLLKRCLRRVRDRRTRRRLARGAGRGSIVAAATWDFPNPTHTFVCQELLGLRRIADLHILFGERRAARGLARRFRPLLRRCARVETLPDLHRQDLAHLRKAHGSALDRFLHRVAAATGRSVASLLCDPLVLRACTFTRLVELAGARYLQSWFFYDQSFMAMFAAEVLGIPRGISCHVDHVLADHPFKLVGLHLATADLILAISDRTRDELASIGGPQCAARILVKHIGVDAGALLPLRELPRADAPFRLLSVSRIEPKKGLHVLLEACARLRDRGHPFTLRIVGTAAPDAAGTAYVQRLRDLEGRLGLADAIEWAGFVANDRLPQLLADATVFVAPYVQTATGDRDGIPTSVVEAMAAGLPVVGTRVGALDEAIGHGDHGLLVEPDDPARLAAAIEQLMDDAGLRRRLGAAAARRFDHEFDHRVVDREYHRRVEQLIARHATTDLEPASSASPESAAPAMRNEPTQQDSLDRIYDRYHQIHGFGDVTGEVFEDIIQSLYRLLLRPGEVAMDLGACTGRHTVPLAHTLGPEGKVIAFEPLESCRQKLLEWATIDRVQDRIVLHGVALSDRRGKARFFAVDGDLVGHSSLREKDAYPAGVKPHAVEVETALLDDFLPPDRTVRFLKADLEGGEFPALRGGRQLLARHRPVLVLESSLSWDAKQFGYAAADYFAFFRELGYELKDILGCPFRPSHAHRIYPHYVVAYPADRAAEVAEALAMAVLENTFGARWFGIAE